MKAVAYIRVSSREQSEGYSLDSQTSRIEEYCLKENLEIDKKWQVTEKASKEGRVAFAEMVEYVKKKQIKVVILEKIDRAVRNYRDVVTICSLMDSHDITFHFLRENIALHKNSRSSDKLMFDVQVSLAKYYVNNLSDEVKKGFEGKISQGGWPGKPPLGYINDKNTKEVIPDPNTAHYVIKMFEWYASGLYSVEIISTMLASEGLTNRTGNEKKLSTARLYEDMKNPFYIGKMEWKGEIYEGKHQPLISEELFMKVQEKLKEKSRPRVFKNSFLFNNLIKCGVCDSTYTAEIKKGKYIYYRCTEHKMKHSHHYWREESLNEEIQTILLKLNIPEEVLKEIKLAIQESHKNEIEFHNNAIRSLQTNLTKVQNQKEQLYDDKLEGLITKEKYLEKSRTYQKKEDKILGDMKKHKVANSKYYDAGIMIIELIKNSSGLYSEAEKEEKREILKFLFSNLTITNEKLEWQMNLPFSTLYDLTTHFEWSRLIDVVRNMDFWTILSPIEYYWNFLSKFVNKSKTYDPFTPFKIEKPVLQVSKPILFTNLGG